MNRKSWLVIKITLLTVFVIALSILFFKLMNSSDDLISVFSGHRYIEGELKDSDVRESIYKNIQSIDIDLVNIPLEIREAQIDHVRLIDASKAKSFRGTFQAIKTKQKGNELAIEQSNSLFFLNLISIETKGKVILEVPKAQMLEYDIDTISGKVVMDARSQGELKIGTISADVEVYKGGERLLFDSVSGRVIVYEPFQYFQGNSVSGAMQVIANHDSERISVDTLSGSLKIVFQKNVSYDVDFSSMSGSIMHVGETLDQTAEGSGAAALQIEYGSLSGNLMLESLNK